LEELKNDDVLQGNAVYLLSFTDEVSGLVFKYPPITSVGDLENISRVSACYDLTGESFLKPCELAEKVYVSGLKVRTPRMEVSKPAPNGFTGWVRPRFRKNAPQSDRRLIAGLLRLGEFTNVGGNRTAGYGVISVSGLASGEGSGQAREGSKNGSRRAPGGPLSCTSAHPVGRDTLVTEIWSIALPNLAGYHP
jgi:hypothetical protein